MPNVTYAYAEETVVWVINPCGSVSAIEKGTVKAVLIEITQVDGTEIKYSVKITGKADKVVLLESDVFDVKADAVTEYGNRVPV